MVRRRQYSKENDLAQLFAVIVVLILAPTIWYFYKNPAKALAWVIVTVLVGFALAISFIYIKHKIQTTHLNNLLNRLKNSGQEDFLKNFINRFGLEGGKNNGYIFRNHRFDWERINDLKKIFIEKRVTSNDKDIFVLLRHFIQEKEESLTRESMSKKPKSFSELSKSGSDFEALLGSLFEAMGYKVEHTGRSGDQGGDLIANKQGERILIQAKSYKDWSTGNSAVQQVVGAMKYYDCNKTMVFTTSHFTQEAINLAKSNQTELVSKEQLQEMLLKHLGESWS